MSTDNTLDTESFPFEPEYDDKDDDSKTPVKYDIVTYPSDLTLDGIKQMWDSGSITKPNFQRNFVWSAKQASKLIDSFLCGLPVPPIFLYVTNDNKTSLIDGQQRVMSIVYYMNGYFGDACNTKQNHKFRLVLDKNNPYNGKTFKELDESDRRKLTHLSVLRAINIKQLSPDNDGSCAFQIFRRLNTEGTPLTDQEIRNCVHQGEFINILRTLNQDQKWRMVIGLTDDDKHQKDIELILRIFSLSYYIDDYKKPMKNFLDAKLGENKDGKTKNVKTFQADFPRAAEIIALQLPPKPFHPRRQLNRSVMDSVFCTVMNNLDRIPEDVGKRFSRLLKNADFIKSIDQSTSDSAPVKARFELAYKALLGEEQ